MIKKLLPLLVLSTISATTVAATPPNTLVVAQGLDDIVSLDPAEANELSSIQTVPSLYQRVVQPDRNDPTKITPILAESWQADPAAKTLTIKLKSDAKFASGNPVRPEDVIYSYVRAVTLNKSGAFILNVLGWQPENIASQLKKIDDHTVQVQWSADVSPALALNILSTPIASIVDEKLVAPNAKNNDFGNEWLKMHSAGSGAFKMRTYQPHQAIVMEANASSTGQPVLKDLLSAFPATIELATLALIVGAVVGVIAGVLCARYVGSPLDFTVRTLTLLGNSVPVFWLGLLMLALFYARLQWSAGPGRLDDIYQFTIEPRSGFALIDTWLSGDREAFTNAINHLILPVLLLAYFSLASITRLTRSACLGEMNKEYILLARAKGASEMTILLRHVLPNIRGTLLTVIALAYTSMLEGAVLTETVFSWPGIGRYLTTALFAGDTTAIMGGTLLIGVCFVLINNLTDLLVRLTDPRLR